ncbi:ADP-ribose pyrophosphatase, partial [Bacillus sp. Ru63]
KRNTPSQLSMLFDFLRHPDKKTIFD